MSYNSINRLIEHASRLEPNVVEWVIKEPLNQVVQVCGVFHYSILMQSPRNNPHHIGCYPISKSWTLSLRRNSKRHRPSIQNKIGVIDRKEDQRSYGQHRFAKVLPAERQHCTAAIREVPRDLKNESKRLSYSNHVANIRRQNRCTQVELQECLLPCSILANHNRQKESVCNWNGRKTSNSSNHDVPGPKGSKPSLRHHFFSVKTGNRVNNTAESNRSIGNADFRLNQSCSLRNPNDFNMSSGPVFGTSSNLVATAWSGHTPPLEFGRPGCTSPVISIPAKSNGSTSLLQRGQHDPFALNNVQCVNSGNWPSNCKKASSPQVFSTFDDTVDCDPSSFPACDYSAFSLYSRSIDARTVNDAAFDGLRAQARQGNGNSNIIPTINLERRDQWFNSNQGGSKSHSRRGGIPIVAKPLAVGSKSLQLPRFKEKGSLAIGHISNGISNSRSGNNKSREDCVKVGPACPSPAVPDLESSALPSSSSVSSSASSAYKSNNSNYNIVYPLSPSPSVDDVTACRYNGGHTHIIDAKVSAKVSSLERAPFRHSILPAAAATTTSATVTVAAKTSLPKGASLLSQSASAVSCCNVAEVRKAATTRAQRPAGGGGGGGKHSIGCCTAATTASARNAEGEILARMMKKAVQFSNGLVNDVMHEESEGCNDKEEQVVPTQHKLAKCGGVHAQSQGGKETPNKYGKQPAIACSASASAGAAGKNSFLSSMKSGYYFLQRRMVASNEAGSGADNPDERGGAIGVTSRIPGGSNTNSERVSSANFKAARLSLDSKSKRHLIPISPSELQRTKKQPGLFVDPSRALMHKSMPAGGTIPPLPNVQHRSQPDDNTQGRMMNQADSDQTNQNMRNGRKSEQFQDRFPMMPTLTKDPPSMAKARELMGVRDGTAHSNAASVSQSSELSCNTKVGTGEGLLTQMKHDQPTFSPSPPADSYIRDLGDRINAAAPTLFHRSKAVAVNATRLPHNCEPSHRSSPLSASETYIRDVLEAAQGSTVIGKGPSNKVGPPVNFNESDGAVVKPFYGRHEISDLPGSGLAVTSEASRSEMFGRERRKTSEIYSVKKDSFGSVTRPLAESCGSGLKRTSLSQPSSANSFKLPLKDENIQILVTILKNQKIKLERKNQMLESDLQSAHRSLETLRGQMRISEEEWNSQRCDFRNSLKVLEKELEEVIKEKAQAQMMWAQVCDEKKKLESNVEQRYVEYESEISELKSKCDSLKLGYTDLNENFQAEQLKHENETKEWLNFQRDLQTAVRVANDLRYEAEERAKHLELELNRLRQLEHALSTAEKLKVNVSSSSEQLAAGGALSDEEIAMNDSYMHDDDEKCDWTKERSTAFVDYECTSRVPIKDIIRRLEAASTIPSQHLSPSNRASGCQPASTVQSVDYKNDIKFKLLLSSVHGGNGEVQENSVRKSRVDRRVHRRHFSCQTAPILTSVSLLHGEQSSDEMSAPASLSIKVASGNLDEVLLAQGPGDARALSGYSMADKADATARQGGHSSSHGTTTDDVKVITRRSQSFLSRHESFPFLHGFGDTTPPLEGQQFRHSRRFPTVAETVCMSPVGGFDEGLSRPLSQGECSTDDPMKFFPSMAPIDFIDDNVVCFNDTLLDAGCYEKETLLKRHGSQQGCEMSSRTAQHDDLEPCCTDDGQFLDEPRCRQEEACLLHRPCSWSSLASTALLPENRTDGSRNDQLEEQTAYESSTPARHEFNTLTANCDKNDILATLAMSYPLGSSRHNALLRWCRERTQDYQVEITNFSSSWSDGNALIALLHSVVPDEISYSRLREGHSANSKFEHAFSATHRMGITCTLDLSDLLESERPSWEPIMDYVTQIYRYFVSHCPVDGEATDEVKNLAGLPAALESVDVSDDGAVPFQGIN